MEEKKRTEIKGVFLSRYQRIKKTVLVSLVRHFGVSVSSLTRISIPFDDDHLVTVNCYADEEEETLKLIKESSNPDFMIFFFPIKDSSKTFFESYIDRFLTRYTNTPALLFSVKDKHSEESLESLPYAKMRIDNRRVLCSNYVSKEISKLFEDGKSELPMIEDPLFFNHIRTGFHFFLQFRSSYGPFGQIRKIKPSLAPFRMPSSPPEFFQIAEESSKRIRDMVKVIEGWEKQIKLIFDDETPEKEASLSFLSEQKQSLDDILMNPDESIDEVIDKFQQSWKRIEAKLILKRYLKLKLQMDYSYRDSFKQVRSEWFPKLLRFLEMYGMDGSFLGLFLAQCSVEKLKEYKDRLKQKEEIHLFDKNGKSINLHLIASLLKDWLMNYPRQPYIQNFHSLRNVKLRETESQKYEDTIMKVRCLLFEKLTYHQYHLLKEFLPFLLKLSRNEKVGSNVDNLSSHFCTIFLFRPEAFQPTVGEEEQFRIVFNQTMGDAQRVMKYLIIHSNSILGSFSKTEFLRLRSILQRKRKEELEIERINWKTAKFYFLHQYWETVVGRDEIGIRKYLFKDLGSSLRKVNKSMHSKPRDIQTFRNEYKNLENDAFFEKLSSFLGRQKNFWDGRGRGMGEFMGLFDQFRGDVLNEQVRSEVKNMIKEVKERLERHRQNCMGNRKDFEKSSGELIGQYRATYREFCEKSVEMKKFKYILLFDEDDGVINEEKKESKMKELERLKTGVQRLSSRLREIEKRFSKKYYECYQVDISNYLMKLRKDVDEKIRFELPRVRSKEFTQRYPQIVCPLTSRKKGAGNNMKKIMKDPVVLIDSGITYEREAITRYLKSGNQLDPVSKRVVLTKKLVPNLMLKKFIDSL